MSLQHFCLKFSYMHTHNRMLAPNTLSYNIRREKGLIRDPKTGKVGPNRSPGMRYTELADEMVVKFGRVGQKALKVSLIVNL